MSTKTHQERRGRLFELGRRKRARVLGADYVRTAGAKARQNHTEEFQGLVTEFCWGAVWSRDVLRDRERSLMCLGIMVALGREFELERHIMGAITNGLKRVEIFEALLFATPYCGIPAVLDALNVFTRVLPIDRDEGRGKGRRR